MPLHIDVESFSRCNLKVAGLWRYWEDDSTRLLIVCWSHGVNQKIHTWFEGMPPPADLCTAIERGESIFAHNAHFERRALVWAHKHLGWPLPKDAQYHCTMAQVATLGLPHSLGNATAAMGMAQQKDKRGAALIKRFCIPQKSGEVIMPKDDPLAFNEFMAYCRQDVRSEVGLCYALPEMQAQEQKVYQLDLKINQRGLPLSRELIVAMQDVATTVNDDLEAKVAKLTGGLLPTQRDKLLAWIGDEGGDIETLKAGDIIRELRDPNLPDNVRAILKLRAEAARVSTKKLAAALACMCRDDRVRGTFYYHGAGPGRWSGRLIQPQNFPRGTLKAGSFDIAIELVLRRDIGMIELLFGSVTETLSSIMRAMVTGSPGKVLSAADYNAIEARALFWFAGQEDGLELYRSGADIYKEMASQIFHVPVSDISDDGSDRFMGKSTVLGCGYQMGVDKFVDDQLTRFDNVITYDLGENCVYGYRNRWKKVPVLWNDTNKAAIRAVESGTRVVVSRVAYERKGDFLFCYLPSGRRIAYPFPSIVMDKRFNKPALRYRKERFGKFVTEGTYGGKLVENYDQGHCRDLMAHGMANADRAGLDVIGTVHDEAIIEHDERQTDALQTLKDCMQDTPEWTRGLPVKTSGYTSKRMRKG